jgi:3-oxoacyl-[acyl-carrier protein] reductase
LSRHRVEPAIEQTDGGRAMAKLKGKIAVITGGASGMGYESARLFVREGARVAILDIKESKAKQAARQLGGGRKAVGIGCDVGDEASVKAAFKAARKAFGPINILVNAAGIDSTSEVIKMPTAMWDEMLRVNLTGTFLCTREVLREMKRQKWGRVINFASQLAHKGGPEMAHYVATKAGVIGFTRSLAYEVIRHGITVNAICPGPIITPLFLAIPKAWRDRKRKELPIGRFGKVEEVAPTVLMLACDPDGAYYVGATLNMNGGDVMV